MKPLFHVAKIEKSRPEQRDWERAQAYLLRENEQGGAPKHRTELRALYSAQKLFLRFDVEDDYILANLKEDNANLYEEEVVELFYAPEGALTRYFELEFNVHGAVFYGLISNPNGNRLGMSCQLMERRGIDCEVIRTSEGYVLTAEISFAAIGGAPVRGALCNAFRIDHFPDGSSQLIALSPTLCVSFHVPAYFVPVEWGEGKE